MKSIISSLDYIMTFDDDYAHFYDKNKVCNVFHLDFDFAHNKAIVYEATKQSILCLYEKRTMVNSEN